MIEVKYVTTMGSGEGVADVPIKMTALYAKGIGMIEQSDESKVGKVVTKQTLKLIDFTPGHPNGSQELIESNYFPVDSLTGK